MDKGGGGYQKQELGIDQRKHYKLMHLCSRTSLWPEFFRICLETMCDR